MTEDFSAGSVKFSVDNADAVGRVIDDRSESQTCQQGNVDEQAAPSKAPPYIPLEPPEDCITVTHDGGVLKKVLEPGEPNSTPSKHARCLIHYVGYLATNGDKFMDTRTDTERGEPVVVIAGRTASAQETGLCLAAGGMCRRERALVYIADPGYGYGPQGSFSFPSVPPNTPLVYEVELLNWEDIEEADTDDNRASLLYEERLERAERRRDAGNTLYKQRQYKDALAKYALALSYLDEDFMFQLEGHYLDKAEALKRLVHLNMAAVQLKTGDWNTAIYNCGQVLQSDSSNVKALYRRAKARHELGRTEEAEADLAAAIKIEPDNLDVKRELAAVRATLKKEREASAKLYKGAFGPSPSTGAGAGAAAGGAAVPSGSPTGAQAAAAAAAAGGNKAQEAKGSSSAAGAAAGGVAAAGSQATKRGGSTGTGTGKGSPGGGKAGAQGAGRTAAGKAARRQQALPQVVVGFVLMLLTLVWTSLKKAMRQFVGVASGSGGARARGGQRRS